MEESKPKPTSRRDCLIEIASRLFANHGFEGATVRRIARECGITEAAIYKHFDNKEHLYEEAIRSKTAKHDIRERLEGARGKGSIEDVLFFISRQILETSRRDPELIRMMLFSSLEGFRSSTLLYKEFRYPFIQFLREELVKRIEAGELRDVNPFITSRCFVGMVMDCALNVELWNNLESTTYSSDAVVNNNVPIFARGLTKPNGDASTRE
jgi:AcrR family transcriptional regulator